MCVLHELHIQLQVQTNLQQVDVNKYVFELTDAQAINHIVVFLLGTIPFQPGFGATVHLLWPNKEWQFLGVYVIIFQKQYDFIFFYSSYNIVMIMKTDSFIYMNS